jgi:hypothetical protein
MEIYTIGFTQTAAERFSRLADARICGGRVDGETRTRTEDTAIFSRVLYQLSYLAEMPANQPFYDSWPAAVFRP